MGSACVYWTHWPSVGFADSLSLLRFALEHQLPSRSLVLERTALGKPIVRCAAGAASETNPGDGAALQPPHVAVSHSGRWIAVGITCAASLGIDLERRRTLRDPRAFIERCCTRSEIAMLSHLPESQHTAAILRLWTIKEAHLKSAGTGIVDKLSSVHTEYFTEGAGWLVSSQRPLHHTRAVSLPAPRGYYASLCCEQGISYIKHFAIRCRANSKEVVQLPRCSGSTMRLAKPPGDASSHR